MIGKRLEVANKIAKRRFKRQKNWGWFDSIFPVKYDFDKILGMLRKTGTQCSCEMCCNERHSSYTKKSERPTIQERRAPDVDDYLEDLLDEKY